MTCLKNTGAVIIKSYNNGYDWYRVWSDGWVEQGGYGYFDGHPFNYPIPLSVIPVTTLSLQNQGASAGNTSVTQLYGATTTYIKGTASQIYTSGYWIVKGWCK